MSSLIEVKTSFEITLPPANEMRDGMIFAKKHEDSNHRTVQGEDWRHFTILYDRVTERFDTGVCYVGPFAFLTYPPRSKEYQRPSRELWRAIRRRIEIEQNKIVLPCPYRFFHELVELNRVLDGHWKVVGIIGAGIVLVTLCYWAMLAYVGN